MEGHFLGPKSPSTTPSRAAQSLNKKDVLVVLVLVSMRIWQISKARIHGAREVQTPQKAAKWIQEIMDRDSIDKVRIEAKRSDIIPVYIRRWDTYIWAWVEYNRKNEVWTYGGIQKNKDKVDENKEGQGRIREMYTDNEMDIREEERQSWDDSGRDNEDSDAGIWMGETLRRKLRIGVTKRSKVNIKRVRCEMLAAYIWKEELFRVEMEEEEKGRRTKMTKTKTTETEEENKTESGEMEATRETWEARQTTRNMKDKTLEGMGFNERAESSSRGGQIRRREQYQQSNEMHEYPKEKSSK